MSDFGELRSLLNASDDEARADAWPQILKLMKAALKQRPHEVSEEWIPYALQALERWPDRLRVAPRDWVYATIRGQPVGLLMALVTAIDASRVNNPRFRAICAHRDFTWVRHLRFAGIRIRLDTCEALGASTPFESLTSLEFESARLGSVRIRAIFSNPFAHNLRELGLIDCELTRLDIISLLGSRRFETLERLDLSLNPWMDDAWRAIAERELPNLRHLDATGSWNETDDLRAIVDAPWFAQLDSVRLARHIPPRHSTFSRSVGLLVSPNRDAELLRLHREIVSQSSLRDEVKAAALATLG